MNWPEIKFAFSLCLAGGFFGCCYLANLNPLFFHLVVLIFGVVLGVVANSMMRDMEAELEYRLFDWHAEKRLVDLLPNQGKLEMVRKLRDLMKDCGDSLEPAEDEARIAVTEPDLYRVENENLWLVVNQGNHFAFKDPKFPGVTVVVKEDFAMRALALGFFPDLPRYEPPKKKRVEANYRKVHK